MASDDIKEFEDAVSSIEKDVYFVEDHLKNKKIETIDTLSPPQDEGSLYKIYLIKKEYIRNIKLRFVDIQNYWTIDFNMPVVEFNRCYYNDKIMRRGRLYFETGFYDKNGSSVEHPKDFIEFADELLKWVRKHYSRDKKTGFYVGPHAKKWQEKTGGMFKEL